MTGRHTDYLDLAEAAVSRRDYLSAMQYGLRAAGAPPEETGLRCDAQMLLAIVSLELGDGETALTYGVGAHLAACYGGDADREQKAEAIVAMIVAQYSYLSDIHTVMLH